MKIFGDLPIWLLDGLLLLLVAIAIVGVEVLDRPEAAVEGAVRRYAAAVSRADLDAALAEIAPEQRAGWREFVQSQLGNVYEVTGVAVSARWLLAPPTDVTTNLDVNRGYPDEFYQPSPRVAVEQSGGQWYLAAPLLAPRP